MRDTATISTVLYDSMSRVLIPEYNTVDTLVRVSRILIILVVVVSVLLLLLPLLTAVVVVKVESIVDTHGVEVNLSAIPLTLLPLLPLLVPLILNIIAIFELSDILSTLRRAVDLANPELFESGRKRLLLWGVITLFTALFIPGLLLLVAYFKGETVAHRLREVRLTLR